MTTFLQLAKDLARESGGGPAPTAVTGQGERQAKMVEWVRMAWQLIQNLNPNWSFLQSEWAGSMTLGQASYLPEHIAFSDASNSIAAPRFGEFLGDRGHHRTTTLYDPTIGQRDEGYLRQISWERWRRVYDVGEQFERRPSEYALAPDGTIRFGYIPDKAYVVRGEYRKAPQVLALDTDIPDMPTRFHDIIVWRAIMLMAESDEAVGARALAETKYTEQLRNMQRDCLPRFTVRSQGPLA